MRLVPANGGTPSSRDSGEPFNFDSTFTGVVSGLNEASALWVVGSEEFFAGNTDDQGGVGIKN